MGFFHPGTRRGMLEMTMGSLWRGWVGWRKEKREGKKERK